MYHNICYTDSHKDIKKIEEQSERVIEAHPIWTISLHKLLANAYYDHNIEKILKKCNKKYTVGLRHSTRSVHVCPPLGTHPGVTPDQRSLEIA